MGLSASQARLLTITSRKSDCEFQSMQLSHEKLSISRDLGQISNEYQNSLDQTKLMYDFYGDGQNKEQLNYNTMMTPSALNDYLPITMTDTSNRVVLNKKYAAAAKAAGIPQEGLGCVPSSTIRDKFVLGLVDSGMINENQAENILKVPFNQEAGLGKGIGQTIVYETIGYDEFVDRIGMEKIVPTNSAFNKNYVKELVVERYTNKDGSNKQLNSKFQPCELTFNDLFTSDYDFILKAAGEDNNNNLTVQGGMADAICNSSIWDTMFTTVEKVLDNGQPKTQQALNYAKSKIKEMVTNFGSGCTDPKVGTDEGNDYSSDGKNIHTNFGAWKEFNDAYDSTVWKYSRDNYRSMMDRMSQASGKPTIRPKIHDTIGMYGIYNHDDDGDTDNDSCMSMVTINLTSMMKAYLTNFAHFFEMNSTNPRYTVGNRNFNSQFMDSTYQFEVIKDVKISSDESKVANYYDTVLNQICISGWSENDEIDDKNYLQQMLQNGMMYITSINDDNFYYQKNYSTWSYVQEVSDDKAIAQAEAKYKTMKEKLSLKEQQLDLKMKNLDTEISALTTEYDTVKNTISKNIEKSFKRYSA